jgi:hypothetical protein
VNLTAKNFECAAANSAYRYLIAILSTISFPAVFSLLNETIFISETM